MKIGWQICKFHGKIQTYRTRTFPLLVENEYKYYKYKTQTLAKKVSLS